MSLHKKEDTLSSMEHKVKRYGALPLPFQEEKKRAVQQKPRHARISQSKRARGEDFPSQSLYQVTQLRMVTLVLVLLAVTLSMLTNFVFLFSGAPNRLQIPVFSFSLSLSLIGLVGAGGGSSILLWITLLSILKPHPKKQSAQKATTFLTTAIFATDGMTSFPPEPTDQQGNKRFSTQRGPWMFSQWEREPQRQAEKQEALRLRQRLHTLRLSYIDDFPDDGQKKRALVENEHGKIIVQRKMDTFLEKGAGVRHWKGLEHSNRSEREQNTLTLTKQRKAQNSMKQSLSSKSTCLSQTDGFLVRETEPGR